MQTAVDHLKARLRAFRRSEEGSSTIEFVLVFPVFMLFFGMTFENGMISLRHVMLERGVDIAVRDIRIGRMPVGFSGNDLRERICDAALIIPNCETQLKLEMYDRDPRAWVSIPVDRQCVDRGDPGAPAGNFINGANNQLVVLRVCTLFDPVMPTTGLGRVISESGTGNNRGTYALVTTTSYVVEPYKKPVTTPLPIPSP